MVQFKGFRPATTWRGEAFHFLPVFSEKEKKKPSEALIVIFEKVSPKGFFWLNMKNFEISVLTANSRYLQIAAQLRTFLLRFQFWLACKDFSHAFRQ